MDSHNAMAYDKVLDVPWHTYRIWAATSRYLKGELSRWTRYTLWLAITGAALAAAGQGFSLRKTWHWPLVARGASILAAFAVTLSAYFGKEALGGNRTSDWAKARSAAESLKSAVFLYRAGAPPFDTADREKNLFAAVKSIEEGVSSIETRSAGDDAKPPDLEPLTVDSYIAKRVDDQIAYYDRRAAEYQAKNDVLRNVVFWLGAASALLALASSVGIVPALVGLVATLTACLSAHAQSQQYQTLIVTYQSTSRRLVELKGQWAASRMTDADTAGRNAFIRSCEDTLALENGAWAMSLTKKVLPSPPPADAKTEPAVSAASSGQ